MSNRFGSIDFGRPHSKETSHETTTIRALSQESAEHSGCFHSHLVLQAVQKVRSISLELPLLPFPRSAIRVITEPVGLHEDPPPISRMGQVEKDSSLCISGRPADYSSRSLDSMSIPRSRRLLSLSRSHTFEWSSTPQIAQRWPDDIEMSDELHRQGPVDVSRPACWENDATPTIRTQEHSSVNIEIKDIDSNV
ncbi:hypothetical protein AYI70_g6376 [Smittium culicis]|uniref:Uncharacterized protein n=1 Tax=Smittium culicis TaxID=133412 RepID=A0A1R1XQ92_9FUNG|nr:hypothetical protein AYI70_g6376 [Smittium culicis]